MTKIGRSILALLVSGASCWAVDEPPVVLADFEGKDYGAWKKEGTAFGTGPANGGLPGQMKVAGFEGKGLANSFHGGDKALGTLTSPVFKIERAYLTFLIGGGGFAGKTCLNLLVDGAVVRTAAGTNTVPGGSEDLEMTKWDVAELKGKAAQLQIVDAQTGTWGHINVDQIVMTDRPVGEIAKGVTREITAERRLLNFPVMETGTARKLTVLVDGVAVRAFDIILGDTTPDWWAPLDISTWTGKKLTLKVDRLPAESRALELVDQTDELKNSADLYHEALRPQFHFSAQRGWLNDPNGLIFANGKYHLFFQHNPYGWGWGNMHWGHATSTDLLHWQQTGEALYPDPLGPMFSGSAVIDWHNTSGFGTPGNPPLVLFYTAAGRPSTQCLAYSTDGGLTFTKSSGNPIIPNIAGGNRDPKVAWHAPTKKWVMALYVGFPTEEKKPDGKPKARDTIQFLTSPDLKKWTVASELEGFYECPDFFELPIDGELLKTKWVVTAASSDYMVGKFDGKTFHPETTKLQGQMGRGFYAAQTYSDIPVEDGRRLQIGWLQAPSPGMPFNQAMTIPLELSLRTTPEGLRVARQPAREMKSLRGAGTKLNPLTLEPGAVNPLAAFQGELVELRAEFTPSASEEVRFTVRGVPIVYDTAKQEIVVHGHRAPAPLRDGVQRLIVFLDRTAIEVFASDGLTYVPLPVIPEAKARGIEVSALGRGVSFQQLEAFELKSIWTR